MTYTLLFIACLVGVFSKDYQANLLQRLSLSTLAFWSIWRIGLVWEYGWGYPHEVVIATSLIMYAIGSLIKTLKWKFNK